MCSLSLSLLPLSFSLSLSLALSLSLSRAQEKQRTAEDQGFDLQNAHYNCILVPCWSLRMTLPRCSRTCGFLHELNNLCMISVEDIVLQQKAGALVHLVHGEVLINVGP